MGSLTAGGKPGSKVSRSQSDGRHTTISGPLADQAALHGVLIKIRDLGIPLLSVQRLDPD